MPSYIPDPLDYIKSQREKNTDGFGTNLLSQGLDVNFARKPWDQKTANFERLEREQFVPTTLGDSEFNVRDYLADAQVPSAHAESLMNDAREKAQDALDTYGDQLDPATVQQLKQIAATGHADDGTNWFTNVLNVVDTPGELIRTAIADFFIDDKAGVEITGQDYLDVLLGNEEAIRERFAEQFRGTEEERRFLAENFMGDDQFLFEGARMLSHLGWRPETAGGRFLRGLAGFGLDIATDPTSYVSFGTVGLGKKAAMEAAEMGIRRAAREGIEAVARGSIDDLTDSASREVAQRIQRRIDAQVAERSKGVIDRLQVSEGVRRRVLAEERRGLDASIGLEVPRRDILDKGLKAEDLSVPSGTVLEEMSSEVLAPLADRQFRTIAQNSPWFTSSRHVPGFAKGGVQVGTLAGRRRFPMLRIPGTETDRLVSAPFRKVGSSLFERMPAGFQSWMRDLGQRTGTEQALYAQAREGSLWRVQAEMNMRDILVRQVLPEEALRPLAHGIEEARRVASELGLEKGEADRAVRDLLNGDVGVLDRVPPRLRAALEEAVEGNAESGIDGIRQVFSTFYDAARRVGMDLGQVPNYSPLVVDGSFSKFLDRIQDAGIDVPVGEGPSEMANLGLAIIGRYLNNSGEGALGLAARDVTYTQFAQSNKVTQVFRSAFGGVGLAEDLASQPTLRELVTDGDTFRLSADTANEAVEAALEVLVARNPSIRKQAQAVKQAFTTDMIETFSTYVASMGEAIQFKDLIRRLRRVGLIEGKNTVIDVSATLASVKGRLTDDMATWIDDLAEGKGTQAASRLMNVKVGGRTLKVPAAVAHHPKFKPMAQRASRAFSRFDKRANEIRNAVGLAERRLIEDGVPEEIAHRLAFATADSDLSVAMNDLAQIALDEADTLQLAALEGAARGSLDGDTAVEAAVAEGRRLLEGVQGAVQEMEDQARRALNLTPTKPSAAVVDLLAGDLAPRGFNSTMEAMGRWALDSLERRVGSVADRLQPSAGRALEGASRQRIAREAVGDLADRATVVNLTVGDLVGFASPRVAARVVAELNGRLLEAGYRGMDSLTDEMLDAAEDVFAAEFRFFSATEGIEEAEAALRAAEKRLDEVSQSLTDSDELLGPAIDHAVETVGDVNDAILMSPVWRDVWASAIHKTGGLPRGEFAENRAQAVAKGLDDLTQKELTAKGAKGPAREAADIARGFWAKASVIEEETLARRAASHMHDGVSPHRKVLEAMLAGDGAVVRSRPDVFREVVASITDANGRQLFDPNRVAFRPNGQIVYEPEAPVWVTLDDVGDSIVAIADNPNISEIEAMRIVKTTWDENPEVVESVDPLLGDFFRQVDAAGGLPADLEDYEYLRRFAADIDNTIADMEAGLRPAVPTLTPEEDQLARRARSNWNYTAEALRPAVRTLVEGGEVADEALRMKARALMKWFEAHAETPGGLIRALNGDEIATWTKLTEGDEFVLDMASSDVGGLFAQKARKGEHGHWLMEFSGNTRAARNELNQIEAARGGDEWLVSGHFKVDGIDHERQIIQVSPSREATIPVAPRQAPETLKVSSESVKKVLTEVDRAFRTTNGRRLLKLWESERVGLVRVMPAEEFSRLSDLVGKASAVGQVRASRFGDEWRALIGSADETADAFAHDTAMLRRQAWDLGEKWAAAAAEDAAVFRDALQRLLSHADNLDANALRPGYQPLEEVGGEFDQAFGEVADAARRLRRTVNKADKDRRVAGFLPEVPNDVDSLDEWLRELNRSMSSWEPVRANTAQKGFVSPKVSQLGGQGLEGLEMTPGVALMFDHLAAGSVAVASPLGIRLAAEAYREVEQWWKAAATVARPTFVPRNVFSGIVNGLLVGVGPRHYAAVRTHVWRFRRNLDELGVEGAIRALPEGFQPYMEGLWRSGLMSTSFSHTLDRLKPAAELGELVNPLSSSNAAFRLGGKVMETSEDFLRAAAFLRWYDPANPDSMKLAKEMALAVHFDYGSLTRMETAIKRFVPFFIWTRRNLPLQMRALVEQPGHTTRLLHLSQNLNASFEGSSFVDDQGFAESPYLSSFAIRTPVVFGEETPHWQRLVVDPALPVNDLEEALEAFSGGPQAAGEWLIRSLSPAFSAPTEIFQDYDTVAPTGLREIFMWSDAVLPGEGVLGYEPTLSGDYEGPAFASNLFRTALPFLGEWTRTLGVVPSSGSQAIRSGVNIEDGVEGGERIKESALSLGRAFGATLQTPEDTRSAAWDAIFGVEDEIDELRNEGKIVDPDDIEALIETILERQGIDFDVAQYAANR